MSSASALGLRITAHDVLEYCSWQETRAVNHTFMQQVVAGEVAPAAIGEFVEAWHAGGGFNTSLHSYLGMTWEEYAAWAKNPRALATIVAKHRPKPAKPVNGKFLGAFVNGSTAKVKKATKIIGRSHAKASPRPSAKARSRSSR